MNQIELKKIVKQLSSLGERQLYNETRARFLIEHILTENKIIYAVQKFTTYIPRTSKTWIKTDKGIIRAMATSFVSGIISNKNHLISSLTSSQPFIYKPNINFNPECKIISRSNHYFAPAVAIAASDVAKIIAAKNVHCRIKTRRVKHQSGNILIGNIKNPENIIFSHYDSIGPGAVDNASGIALSLWLIKNNPSLLETCLFVLAGNEELSYDQPLYWGYGYRMFEKTRQNLLSISKKIIVLDCIGHTSTKTIRDINTLMLGFPIISIKKLSKKIVMLSGDIQKLMKIYHSDLDTWDKINYQELERAGKIALRLLGATNNATS